jgi:DNA-binding transcriptional regulator YbjK
MRRDAKTSILEATLQLIAAGGVDAVRYRAVARAAKLQLGTVSYHFAAREDLIRAAFAFFLTENTAALVALRGRFASGGLDAVADYLTELVRADCADRRRRHLAEYELIV